MNANKILTQALNSKDDLRLLAVGYSNNSEKDKIESIQKPLDLKTDNQIKVYNKGAKSFISDAMSKDYLSNFITILKKLQPNLLKEHVFLTHGLTEGINNERQPYSKPKSNF